MGISEEQRIRAEATRSVANRAGGITRYERAMQRYLSAEDFGAHPERTPEGWESKPQHPATRATDS